MSKHVENKNESGGGDRKKAKKCGGAAETIGDIPGQCGAKRSANAHGGTDHPLRKIEMAASPHDVGDDERNQYAKRRS